MSCCPAEVYVRVRHLDPPSGGQGKVVVMKAFRSTKLYVMKGMCHTSIAVSEALISKHLPPHPNIVPFERVAIPLPDADADAEPLVTIRMPYCDRGDLLRFSTNRHFTKAGILLIMRQVVDGVQHLHSNGICHRDLKPNNIFLSSTGEGPWDLQALVGDLGLCCPLGELAPRAGTPGYISPEVRDAPPNQPFRFTAAVDCYGVGKILEGLLGRLSPPQDPARGNLEAITAVLMTEDPANRMSLHSAKERLLAIP